MLSTKIDKILLAEYEESLLKPLTEHLRKLAPWAALMTTTSVSDTCKLLDEWKPALAVIDFSLQEGNFIEHLQTRPSWCCAPFTLGISDNNTCEETTIAMLHGFSYVLDKPIKLEKFDMLLQQIVSEPAPLEVCLNRFINPLMYSNTDHLDLKRVSEEIERHIFNAAQNLEKSKSGLARLLGISRQLVQYHLKKSASDNHPLPTDQQ